MKSRAVVIALVTVCSGILSAASAEESDICALAGGVRKGALCFLPCDNPGDVRTQQPNGQLTCGPPGQPAPPDQPAASDQPAAAQPAAPAKPAASANQATDECVGKGGVRVGDACFLPCPNPNETRVQLADGTLKCLVIAPPPKEADTKAKDKKAPPSKKR